ncbi:MAG: hypothetical protein WAR79_17300 [Melioribacteraceae bacterium]
MKKIIISFILILLFTSCATSNYVTKDTISKILKKNVEVWTLDECNEIINFYTSGNISNQLLTVGYVNPKVKIKSTLLNTLSIKAIAKKEVIEKRLSENDYYKILKSYLIEFTNFTYDEKLNKIVETGSDSLKGYSFKMYFENISSPYEPIFLEDGYSYFFLENMNGEFSRVMNVSGLFVEDYFQLDGYLNAIITFSPFTENGKPIFNSKDLNENYKIVFNGLQTEPITISWKVM